MYMYIHSSLYSIDFVFFESSTNTYLYGVAKYFLIFIYNRYLCVHNDVFVFVNIDLKILQ